MRIFSLGGISPLGGKMRLLPSCADFASIGTLFDCCESSLRRGHASSLYRAASAAPRRQRRVGRAAFTSSVAERQSPLRMPPHKNVHQENKVLDCWWVAEECSCHRARGQNKRARRARSCAAPARWSFEISPTRMHTRRSRCSVCGGLPRSAAAAGLMARARGQAGRGAELHSPAALSRSHHT